MSASSHTAVQPAANDSPSAPAQSPSSRAGILSAFGAFILWGLLPLYWKAIQHVPAYEILCHRIVWSLVFTALILAGQRRFHEIRQALRHRRTILCLSASSLLVTANWGLYIWAVNAGFIVETSLGYYINPLVNVLLGFIFFRERLAPLQTAAICLATAGVLNLVIGYGQFPWIAVGLALTFGFYGLVRKVTPLESLPGLFCETFIATIPALIVLGVLSTNGAGAFGRVDISTDLLLAGAGIATSTPLLAFAFGARRITLASLGILQYVAPTIAFCIGVFVYREPFTVHHLVTFLCIWTGIALFSFEGLRRLRRRHSSPKTP